MKALFPFAALLLTALTAAAQEPTYKFEKAIDFYDDISKSISVNNNEVWDDPEYIVPIGFDFILFGKTIDSLYLGTYFGGAVSDIDSGKEGDLVIMPYDTDLGDRGLEKENSHSPISYVLEGKSGNRIFKLQWKNAGFEAELYELGTSHDFVNVQLWLYEGSNVIEMRYGPSFVGQPEIDHEGEPGAYIGLENWLTDEYYNVIGNPSSPEVRDSCVGISGEPANGTVYRFIPANTITLPSTPEVAQSKVMFNPSSKMLTIQFSEDATDVKLVVVDALGRTVYSYDHVSSSQTTLHDFDQPIGIYFYYLTSDKTIIGTGKFLVE